MATPRLPADLEIAGAETLRPTPDILDALEKDYPLSASIADLVDNSIDARARRVLIRFVRKDNRLVNLYVVDNGRGMNARTLRRAMQFAARRDYRARDLGMFGVGLKTASLSHARVLTVVSRQEGSNAVGRQWTTEGIKRNDWTNNILAERSVKSLLDRKWGFVGYLHAGTIVRWDNVLDFERVTLSSGKYLNRVLNDIVAHLGLKLHRFLEQRLVRIQIDIEDLDESEISAPREVNATNPFPPPNLNGAKGYPKDFVAKIPSLGPLTMRAHIWRKKSTDPGYKIGQVAEHQGLYFYRHGRLIQDGGWCGVVGTTEPHLSLARVEIEIPDRLRSYLRVKSNKASVDVPSSFGEAVLAAKAADGTTLENYIDLAEEVYRRRGKQTARPILQPGAGIPSEVKYALDNQSVSFISGRACSVEWGALQGSEFVEIDRKKRKIILNKKYRPILLRGEHGGSTDVPIIRTLLYFTLESLLSGKRVGPVEKLRLKAIQASLNAALKTEKQWANR